MKKPVLFLVVVIILILSVFPITYIVKYGVVEKTLILKKCDKNGMNLTVAINAQSPFGVKKEFGSCSSLPLFWHRY